ncbi:putative DNA excision repair protein [Myxozyma melibiosi]|uniref:DNA excision repair protein n=1 Tax=Myxozyma melibiosi TaxID=54550 RepID=A0ABR1FF09_9ASCO
MGASTGRSGRPENDDAKARTRVAWSSDEEPESSSAGRRSKSYSKRRRDPRKRAADAPRPQLYVDRRRKFDSAVVRDGKNLWLPPDYSGFSVFGNHGSSLKQSYDTRPSFPGSSPHAPYADLVLDSGGTIPAPVAQWLRPYQIDGVAALHERYVKQSGFLLCDDMGLGKTIQVIAFLTAAFGKTADSRDASRMRVMRDAGRRYPRVLIICPGTLFDNWTAELKTWGWWVVDVYHGAKKDEVLAAAEAGSLEIMLTAYQTYQIHESKINMIEWDCCIADECHLIKEQTSKISAALVNVNSLCRIGLTGTALQNKYEDLWTLLDWANPGAVGSRKSWMQMISAPLKAGQSHNATANALAKARVTAMKLRDNVLSLFLLRRTKELIADQLPKKRDMVVFCDLSPLQKEAYQNYFQSDDELFKDEDAASEHFLSKCTTGLKMADHLALCLPRNEEDKEEKQKSSRILSQALPNDWQRLMSRSPVVNYSDPELCGKWKILRRLLQHWRRTGDKVLLFSYSTRMLDMIDHLLTSYGNYSFCRLDGSMTYLERQRQVDKYNNDPSLFIFLISTRAGGVGLNLVSANRVVLWDLNWNPTHDLQAMDRAFRLGQKRDVEVYRLVSAGTIEEIIYARQIYKQQQANIAYTASMERRYFDGVAGEKGQAGELFGLRNILSYNQKNSSLRNIVNRTNIAEAVSAETGLDIQELKLRSGGEEPSDEIEDEGVKKSANAGLSDDESMEQNFKTLLADNPAVKSNSGGGGGSPRKKRRRIDPVTAILDAVGVKYAHDHGDVVGPSRVEQQISKDAIRRFEDERLRGDDRAIFDRRRGDEEGVLFHPPQDVRCRQLNSIARHFGYESTVEFGLYVESLSIDRRRELLSQFYREME